MMGRACVCAHGSPGTLATSRRFGAERHCLRDRRVANWSEFAAAHRVGGEAVDGGAGAVGAARGDGR